LEVSSKLEEGTTFHFSVALDLILGSNYVKSVDYNSNADVDTMHLNMDSKIMNTVPKFFKVRTPRTKSLNESLLLQEESERKGVDFLMMNKFMNKQNLSMLTFGESNLVSMIQDMSSQPIVSQ
jgi:hypothetical protein